MSDDASKITSIALAIIAGVAGVGWPFGYI
jgi:hypothetical protein